MEDNGDTVRADDPAGEAPPAHLPSRPAPRPERHPLRLLLAIVLTTAVVLAVIYHRVYKRRTALLNMQQAALRYVRPADMVVYDEQPARAAALLARGGEHVPVPTN